MWASARQRTTTTLMSLLYSASEYMMLRDKKSKDIGFYQSLSLQQIFESKQAEDPTQFFREIEAATRIAKNTPKQKCWMNMGVINGLVIYQPEDVEEIWSKHQSCLETQESVKLFGHYFGKDVIMALGSNQPEYKKLRGRFSETLLHSEGLEKLRPGIRKTAEYFINEYERTGKMDLKKFASRFTLETILKGVIKVDTKEATKDKLAVLIDQGISQAVTLKNVSAVEMSAVTPWKSVKTSANTTISEAKKIILEEIFSDNNLSEAEDSWIYKRVQDEKKTLASASWHQKASTQVANFFRSCCYKNTVEEPSVKSEKSVLETAFLVTAGSETTSNHFAFTFLALMKHPHVLEKLMTEVDEVRKNPQEMDQNDFSKMPYLNCVILESLRLLPPLSVRKIKVKQDFILKDGTQIKKGDHIFVNVKELHRSKTSYEKPDEFIPERFLKEDLNKVLELGYMKKWQPFGRLRTCPGRKLAIEEMRTALVHFVYHFNMTLINQDWELSQTKTTFGTTPVSDKPFEVKLEKRSNCKK